MFKCMRAWVVRVDVCDDAVRNNSPPQAQVYDTIGSRLVRTHIETCRGDYLKKRRIRLMESLSHLVEDNERGFPMI